MTRNKETSSSLYSDTILEIDWSSIEHNISYFRNKLEPNTKIMLMVKASAYGHSATQIGAKVQEKQLAEYLGVATITEGIELRNMGIELPIMVQNVNHNCWDALIEHCLEPVIHSFELLHSFHSHLKRKETLKNGAYPAHLKLNTGMNRLGFDEPELPELIQFVKGKSTFKITSILSHLSSSGSFAADHFTKQQLDHFSHMSQQLKGELGTDIFCHVLNTDGINNYLDYQMDMVRLGIGLFGTSEASDLKPSLNAAARLKTKVIATRRVASNEFVSYNRSGKLEEASNIAVLSLGYDDGFPRKLGNGHWQVEIKGKLYPTIGNICMDLCMVNLGQDQVNSGDEALIFGGKKSIFDYAEALETITYEALTNIGNRVARVLV